MNTRLHQSFWFVLLACLSLAFADATAQVQAGRELVRLDPKNHVHDIAINSNVATTITFPEKISLLTGYGLVTDPGQMTQMSTAKVSTVHYENVAGDTLVVRLIKPGDPCHATVRTTRSIYLLRFNSAEEANLAVLVSPPSRPAPRWKWGRTRSSKTAFNTARRNSSACSARRVTARHCNR